MFLYVCWCGAVVRCGDVWCGAVRCGGAWRGVVWRGVVWCVVGVRNELETFVKWPELH